MSHLPRQGIPEVRTQLAPTPFTAPAPGDRVTVIPDVPFVPVASLLAVALAADDSDRGVAWVEFPSGAVDESAAWEAVRDALAAASRGELPGDAATAVVAHLSALTSRLLLVVTLDARVEHDVDAGLLALLAGAPMLSLAAICTGRRLFETMGRASHGAIVVSPSTMILGPEAIAAFSAGFGLQLSVAEATALARSPLALPDLLPAVLGSMTLEALETPDDAVLDLLDEAEHYLTMRFRAADDSALHAALAIPAVLTSAVLSALDPGAAGGQQLERAAQAGVLQREDGAGKPAYRMEATLRRTVMAELRRRDPELVRELDARLGSHFHGTGAALTAIGHFNAAEDWDAAVDAIDGAMFRLVADDSQGLRDAILALPRRVRDGNPRLALCLELDWQPGDEPAQGHLVVTRRASGTIAALPDVMSPWDRLHLHLVKTIVLRLKGDYAGALDAADAIDTLLDTDDIAARPLGTLAEANYQSGMTRLLGLDLVGARESFTRSFALARGLGDVQGDRAARAAEATALVRALEGEAGHASGLLAHVDSGTFGTAGLVARALVSIGRLDPRDARHWLARLASSHHDDEFWPFAVHATDRYGLYWGDPVETDADLDRSWAEHGEKIVAGSTAQLLLTSDAADLALMLGQQSRAEAALDQCAVRNSWIAVSRARLALLSGSPKHALLFILEGQGRGRTERYGQLDLAVLRAAAEFALGREEDATASLLRAVNQSGKSGVIVPFHLLPHETLHALAALHPEVDRFVRLHGLTGTSYLAPYQKVAGALSERELVVLRALDPGATVEQIAKKLFVASNTVKAQLRSIYRKLNVSTRTEALLVAAELGLLDQDSRSA
ncbi:MAG: hypothetical protein JWP19_2061 [Rhodoglobus sp.]|nr:hypothetical protein [Rhodoglobus sp.]